jgi:uncharacterized protein YjbJ (UPF0337 family)
MRRCFASAPGNLFASQALTHTGSTKKREDTMNKERIEGSFDQAKGKVKEGIGKATGDAKLESEGKADQVAGKVENAIGGAKDAIKDAADSVKKAVD